MDISSRQIIALGAPLIVTYLTYSAVSGQAKVFQQLTGSAAVGASTASKRPLVGALVRNPFAPVGDPTVAEGLAAALEGEDAEQTGEAPLHLDGTAIAGTWRMAIINGQRVFEGQAFRGKYRLSAVGTDSVTVIAPSGGTLRLSLDVARPGPAPAAAATGAAANGATAKGALASAESGTKAPAAAALERGLDALKGGAEAQLLAEVTGNAQR